MAGGVLMKHQSYTNQVGSGILIIPPIGYGESNHHMVRLTPFQTHTPVPTPYIV